MNRLALILCLLLAAPAHGENHGFSAGEYNVRTSYVLGPKEYIRGTANATTLKVRKDQLGPVITSLNYAKLKAANAGRWEYEGANVRNYAGYLTIACQDGVPVYCHQWEAKGYKLPETRADAAVQLWAVAPTLENLHVHDYAGTAFRLGYGTTSLAGKVTAADREQTRTRNLSSQQAYSGLEIENGADGVYEGCEFYNGRDRGILCNGASNHFKGAHVAGFLGKPTKEDPDRGIGYLNGPHANVWEACVADYCSRGFVIRGPGTIVRNAKVMYCVDVGIDAERPMTVDGLEIENPGGRNDGKSPFNDAPLGVLIRRTAGRTIINGGKWSGGQATHFVGARCEASNCVVRNDESSWGDAGSGKVNDTVCQSIGEESTLVTDNVLIANASGFGVGIDVLYPLGERNTLIVNHDGSCEVPIRVKDGVSLTGVTVLVNDEKWEEHR